MGCYMNGFGEGATGKAEVLMRIDGVTETLKPEFIDPKTGKVSVCIVNNGWMEAVAVAYSQAEFDEFNDPEDDRPKMFLVVDCGVVDRYAPDFKKYVEKKHANKYVPSAGEE